MRIKTAQLCALMFAMFSASLNPCFAFEYASADLEQLRTIDPAVIRAEDDATFIDRYLDELHLAPELQLMLRRILPQHPHLDDTEQFASTISYAERGRRALAESDPASAISNFVKALQLDPAANETRDLLLTAYERFEQQQESAKTSPEEIIKKKQALSHFKHGGYGVEATLHYNQGVALHQAGFFDKAVNEYNAALKIAPGMAEAWTNLALIQMVVQQHLDDALFSIQHAHAFDPAGGFTISVYANILEARGDNEDAIRFYRRAIKIWHDPKLVAPYSKLANLLRRTGRTQEADEILKQIPRQSEPGDNDELNPT